MRDYILRARETYRKIFGDEIHCGSITDFDFETLPDCDLVFGGPPCQGFSVAGKMDPDDPRSKLVFEFQKVVKVKCPRYFVMENVAALGRLEKFAAVRKRLLDGYRRACYNKATEDDMKDWIVNGKEWCGIYQSAGERPWKLACFKNSKDAYE